MGVIGQIWGSEKTITLPIALQPYNNTINLSLILLKQQQKFDVFLTNFTKVH